MSFARQKLLEVKKEFGELVKVLHDDCVCVRPECGCETSRPINRIHDLIQELEGEIHE